MPVQSRSKALVVIALCVIAVKDSSCVSIQDVHFNNKIMASNKSRDSTTNVSMDDPIDEAKLDTANDAGVFWNPSPEYPNPIAADWFIYIDRYANISSNATIQGYFENVGLEYTQVEGDFDGIWAAFYSNDGLPPSSRIRYPQISYTPVNQNREFDFIEVTFFLHGNAAILINTTFWWNPLIRIDKTSSIAELWNTQSFSLQGLDFASAELRAMDNEQDCVFIDSIVLIRNITAPLTITTIFPTQRQDHI